MRSRCKLLMLVGLLILGMNLAVRADRSVPKSSCQTCHDEMVSAISSGKHGKLECISCHPGANEHAKSGDPASVLPKVDFSLELCGKCHQHQYETYLYDDQNKNKVGRFGGSPPDPKDPQWAKTKDFPLYNKIVAGHGFAKEYNEDRAHKYILEDHYKVTRGKFETCIQCKSTKVAYYWGRERKVTKDTEVTLYHIKEQPKVIIPAGTVVKTGTDWSTHKTTTVVKFPDGTTFKSDDPKAEPMVWATMWAAVFAMAGDEMPTGTTCTHCHDPHSASKHRIIRVALKKAIEEGGVNPYAENKIYDFEKASKQDKINLMCGQCHSEYVCGRGVDGFNRDIIGLRKPKELEELFTKKFEYLQDWRHKIIDEPLIKSQHPEIETFYNSKYYNAGASCADCHMPKLKWGGKEFTSHWFTSPTKYLNLHSKKEVGNKKYGAFPCLDCHKPPIGIDKDDYSNFLSNQVIRVQEKIFDVQQIAQNLLSESIDAIEIVKKAKQEGKQINEEKLKSAIENHRRAYLYWENLIVSENSMGFHNPEEIFEYLAESIALASKAKELAREALLP